LKTYDAFRAQLIAGLVAGSLVLAPAAQAQAQKKAGAPAASAAADKPLDKQQLASAKKHYGDGVIKYNSNDFAGALQDFQAADDVKQTPQTARYIGLCLDNLGRFADAVPAYNRFLSNVPPKMALQGDEIKARVSAIQLLPGKVHVTSDPTSSGFSVDGKPQPNPTPAVVELPAGHHALHFTAPGHDAVDKDLLLRRPLRWSRPPLRRRLRLPPTRLCRPPRRRIAIRRRSSPGVPPSSRSASAPSSASWR
jgi:hypothetical protein